MSAGSTVLEDTKVNEEKLNTLVGLLRKIGIEGKILENYGIKYFDNNNILIAIKDKILHYVEYPGGVFKPFRGELEEMRETLGLNSVNIPSKMYDGDSSHLRDFFALHVKFYK